MHNNRRDAFTVAGSERDTAAHKQARVSWLEMFMFPKACLPILPGGSAKARRNQSIVANRLERWAAGERKQLCDELPSPPRRGFRSDDVMVRQLMVMDRMQGVRRERNQPPANMPPAAFRAERWTS